VTAMKPVEISKQKLQKMRNNGWDSLLADIVVPDMDHLWIARGRSRRRTQEDTNVQSYRVELLTCHFKSLMIAL